MGAQNPFIQSGSESPLFWRAGAGVGAGASDQPAPQAPLCTGGGAAAAWKAGAAGAAGRRAIGGGAAGAAGRRATGLSLIHI